jgi:hypothetical protein
MAVSRWPMADGRWLRWGGTAAVVERQDVGVVEAGRDLDLSQKPLRSEQGGELWLYDLDGDVAVVLQVFREVDGRHAAAAQLALDPVAAGQRGAQLFEGVAHERAPFQCPVLRRVPRCGRVADL